MKRTNRILVSWLVAALLWSAGHGVVLFLSECSFRRMSQIHRSLDARERQTGEARCRQTKGSTHAVTMRIGRATLAGQGIYEGAQLRESGDHGKSSPGLSTPDDES